MEFRYTARTFSASEKVRFRYKLQGLDAAWQDADTPRVAVYTDLAPGTYCFRVVAINEQGLANATCWASWR